MQSTGFQEGEDAFQQNKRQLNSDVMCERKFPEYTVDANSRNPPSGKILSTGNNKVLSLEEPLCVILGF